MAFLNPIKGYLASPVRLDAEVLAFPLSPEQHRMWLANQENPGDPAYNASFRWRLEGPLDPTILQQALNEIVARHEILRATFVRSNGTVSQIISPSLKLLIPVTDLQRLAVSDLEAEVERICASEATRSFSLEKGPLIRVGLLRLSKTGYMLTLTLHHIICDGWSIGVIMRELKAIYSAIAKGEQPNLPVLPIQFADYLIWRADQARIAFDRELEYWTNQLRGYHPTRVIPDLPASPSRSIESKIISRLLPRSTTDALKAFCDRESGTMFSTTLAVCAALLHANTGESDIAIESPMAGRDRTEIEGLIGLFVNRVIIRVDVSGDPTFAELAGRVRATVWEALEHQQVPFAQIMEALAIDANDERETLCPVNFICQRAFGGSYASEFDFAGIQVSPVPSKSPGTLHDLNVFIVERDDGWRLSLEYKAEVYSYAKVNRLLEDFCGILDAIAEDPDLRLSESGASGCAAEKFLASLQRAPDQAEPLPSAPTGAPTQSNLVEQFEMPASVSQVRFWRLSKLRPDSSIFNMPAAVRITGTLSAELLEKSIQAVIDSQEILRTTFKEINGKLVQLISSEFAFNLPISDVWEIPGNQTEGGLQDQMLEEVHKVFDLENKPALRVRLFRFAANDHVLVVTLHHIVSDGWSQGIFQRELWKTYEALSEGRVAELTQLPIQYADFAVWQDQWLSSEDAEQRLNYWVKALAAPLPVLDFPSDFAPGQRPAVRGAVEGMQLPAEAIGQLKKLAQSENVTMFMLMLSVFAILLERYTDQQDLTIGSPSANRSSQTDSLIGPFSGPIALRIDLSGNPTFKEILRRVREVTVDALENASFPFEILLDRLKVRSRRGRNPLFQFYFTHQPAFLQPREIAGLSIAPMSAISVGNPFELQLAIIERSDGVWANIEYDQGLFESKSIQNVMSYFRLLLDQVAVDPERRIAEFSAPQLARRDGQSVGTASLQERLAPRSPQESKIAEMWKQVFDLPHVGIRDDFFDLGGHSLLAARLFSLIEKEFDVKLDLSKLLVARTVEQLALLVAKSNGTEQSSLIPLRIVGTRAPLFCVHGGGGHVLSYQDLADALPQDLPVYGLSAPELDGAQKSMTVEQLATFYIQEIRRLQPNGPYRLCGYSFGGFVAAEMAAQLLSEGEDVPLLAILDTANSGYYRNLPLKEWLRFWTTRSIDRIKRYYRRLADRRLDVALSSAFFFLRKNVHLRVWTFTRGLFRVANRPLPRQMRDNLTMFKAEARSYRPRAFPGRVVLFRVDQRDPEYNHNTSLGWELIATKGVSVHYVSGDHLSFMRQPFVQEVAQQLKEYID